MNTREINELAAAIKVSVEDAIRSTGNDAAFKKAIEALNQTNALLRELVVSQRSFTSTLTSFLNEDHKAKLERERKELEQAKLREPTEGDLKY